MSAIRRIGGVLLLAGCSGANAGQSDPQPCAPVEAAAPGVTADSLDGEFNLQLVATSGSKRGTTAAGQLTLMPQDSGYRRMDPGSSRDTSLSLPLYGTASMDFASVGAVIPGDPGSSNPANPGVLVLEHPGRVMLRLGSEANRRDVRRFDGAYTALQVQQVTDKGFAGTWRSGLGAEESGGHFCADRVS
jgi:hypothetical protein